MASTRQIIHIIYSKSHTEQNINILSRFFIFKTYNTSKWFNSMPAEFYECFNTKNFLNWKTALLEYPWIRKSIDWISRATGKVQRDGNNYQVIMLLPLVKKSYPIWGQRCKKNPHWLHLIWKFSFSDDQSHVSSFQWWPKWWLEKRYRPILEDILLHAFEVLDPAKHGFLSKEELIKQRTKEGEPFSQEDTEEMLSATTDQNRIQFITRTI